MHSTSVLLQLLLMMMTMILSRYYVLASTATATTARRRLPVNYSHKRRTISLTENTKLLFKFRIVPVLFTSESISIYQLIGE